MTDVNWCKKCLVEETIDVDDLLCHSCYHRNEGANCWCDGQPIKAVQRRCHFIHIFDIDWNTDGELIDDLPQEMAVKDDEEEFVDDDGEINNGLISDWLSDRTGWLVNSFSWKFIDEEIYC